MSILDTTLPGLFPEQFFDVSFEVHRSEKSPTGRGKEKFLLPDTSVLLDEEKFADVFMAWGNSGLFLECQVNQAFEDACYPRFDEGDCLEIFIDTRCIKDAGVVHRFCHHFLFLPVEVQGVNALEITQFRGEDRHPIADPEDIELEVVLGKKDYTYKIFLPKEVLFGYDPVNLPRLGFAYRIHRAKGTSQHFTISTKACSIEKHPALWATLTLKE